MTLDIAVDSHSIALAFQSVSTGESPGKPEGMLDENSQENLMRVELGRQAKVSE